MSRFNEPRYGWVMVALGALMTCIFSLATPSPSKP